MNLRFAMRLARREARSSARRLGVYMGAITLGVAALVAINSFRANVVKSVEDEAKTLLGADLRVSSSTPFPDSVVALIDSLHAEGHDLSRVTATVSVVLSPVGMTRLVQLRGITGGFPFYGRYTTDPAGEWDRLEQDRIVFVEPALMIALDLAPGDSLRIGQAAFAVAGTVTNLPPEVDFRSGIAPRVFISARGMDETGLLRFGSLVRYQAYFRMPDDDAERFIDRNRQRLRRNRVGFDTAQEQAEDLAFALDMLGRFLGLVGLAALLLGGLGVGSAVHVFVKDKRPAIAVLRCVGATQRTAFVAYLLQAALLGFAGAALGAFIGIAVQPLVPRVLGELLPVQVAFSLHWPSVLAGLAIGVLVATLFALLPLLAIRGITPLQALRHEVEPERRRDPWRIAAFATLALSILALAVAQAGRWATGLAFAGALTGTLILLALAAWLLGRAARRYFPRHARFVVRQGVASLHRPHNQTAAVTVALGFGVFIVATIWMVQGNLLRRFDVDSAEVRANLVAFDIQFDQREDLLAAFDAQNIARPELVPIVPARIAAIDGRTVPEILGDSTSRVEPWSLRREYRNTYRAALSSTERLVAGEWWNGSRAGDGDGITRVSVEEDVAQSLGVGIGSRITWSFQGINVETRITNIRRVDWARFETNFFFVFEPGAIENAPQSFVTLAQVPDPTARAAIQRDVVRRHPNISFVDLALVQETISRIVGRVTLAIRFMGFFAIIGGVLVLAGAIAASRFQRLRESVLLRTLGATRRQVQHVLLTEYFALGSLAGIAGTFLALAAAWALTRFFFEMDFNFPFAITIAACLASAFLAVSIGLASSRDALTRTPLAVLRSVDE